MATNTAIARQEIIHLISRKKKVSFSLTMASNSFYKMGFDMLDIVDIILEVEKRYNVTIPDEVPLESVDDLVQFIARIPAANFS